MYDATETLEKLAFVTSDENFTPRFGSIAVSSAGRWRKKATNSDRIFA